MAREQYLPSIGHVLHARREPHGMTLRRVVDAQIITDFRHHHFARVKAHADRESKAILETYFVRITPELLLNVECRVARPLSVVLMRNRRPEQRHDPVAGKLVDRAFEAMNAVGEDRKEAIHNRVPLLGIDLFSEVHRALHVREEDGHLLALAFESGTRRQDLLSE